MMGFWREFGELFGEEFPLFAWGLGEEFPLFWAAHDVVEHLGEGCCLVLQVADLLVLRSELLDEGGDVRALVDHRLGDVHALGCLIIAVVIFSQHVAFPKD